MTKLVFWRQTSIFVQRGTENSTPCSDIRTDLQVRRSAFCDWSRHHALTSELDLQVASGSREPGGPDTTEHTNLNPPTRVPGPHGPRKRFPRIEWSLTSGAHGHAKSAADGHADGSVNGSAKSAYGVGILLSTCGSMRPGLACRSNKAFCVQCGALHGVVVSPAPPLSIGAGVVKPRLDKTGLLATDEYFCPAWHRELDTML